MTMQTLESYGLHGMVASPRNRDDSEAELWLKAKAIAAAQRAKTSNAPKRATTRKTRPVAGRQKRIDYPGGYTIVHVDGSRENHGIACQVHLRSRRLRAADAATRDLGREAR